jgi:uncharacterized protein GlcG (DUF336 family)
MTMSFKTAAQTAAATTLAAISLGVSAQQSPPPYGMPIPMESATKAIAASVAEARKNNWTMVIAITDTAGNLIAFQKMDNTQTASGGIAIDKARAAAIYKRPTKAFEDRLASGGAGLQVFNLPGSVALDGGFPIVIDGKIVGGMGASGATGAQDAQVVKAGLATIK